MAKEILTLEFLKSKWEVFIGIHCILYKRQIFVEIRRIGFAFLLLQGPLGFDRSEFF